ncbi:MAG: anti-sigma factor domain-containing protein [Candidatus Desulforudis sp.]|nr:anti-sigma factor domain-containing protein [Desulforudis sp.]
MNHKGIVFRLKKRTAIVMTGEFQFTEIARRPGMVVGAEVQFVPAEVVAPRRFNAVGMVASLIVLALMLTVLWRPFSADPVVYAYVGIDINPSIEMAVDTRDRISEATALNQDGQRLLEQLELTGRPVAEALEAYLRLCLAEGYLSRGQVIIGVTAAEGQEAGGLVEALADRARAVVDENATATDLYVLTCTPGMREQARALGLSTATLAIVEEARKTGVAVDSESVRRDGLAVALEHSGGDLGGTARGLAVAHQATPRTPPGLKDGTPPGLKDGQPQRLHDKSSHDLEDGLPQGGFDKNRAGGGGGVLEPGWFTTGSQGWYTTRSQGWYTTWSQGWYTTRSQGWYTTRSQARYNNMSQGC